MYSCKGIWILLFMTPPMNFINKFSTNVLTNFYFISIAHTHKIHFWHYTTWLKSSLVAVIGVVGRFEFCLLFFFVIVVAGFLCFFVFVVLIKGVVKKFSRIHSREYLNTFTHPYITQHQTHTHTHAHSYTIRPCVYSHT